jgi:hypothetical protein
MEGEDKSKKVAKEKRSVKKTKAVALPVEEVVAEPRKTPVRKRAGSESAKRSASSTPAKEPGYEQIQLRAYFIGERRKSLGILGDETSDWVQAERELREELAAK